MARGYSVSPMVRWPIDGPRWNVDQRVVWATLGRAPALPPRGVRESGLARWTVDRCHSHGAASRLAVRHWRGVLRRVRTDTAAFNAIGPRHLSVVYPIVPSRSAPLPSMAVPRYVRGRQSVGQVWRSFRLTVGRLLHRNNNSDRIFIAPMDGSGTPRALTSSGVSERSAAFSPNGRWIAYEELAHGQPNVYLIAANGTGARRQVSVEGGEQPRWTRGGREIAYRRGTAVMVVPMEPVTGEIGTPTELFRKGQPDRLGGGRTLAYDVSADGNRFLLVVPEQKAGAQPVVVVLNWLEELTTRTRTTPARQ